MIHNIALRKGNKYNKIVPHFQGFLPNSYILPFTVPWNRKIEFASFTNLAFDPNFTTMFFDKFLA